MAAKNPTIDLLAKAATQFAAAKAQEMVSNVGKRESKGKDDDESKGFVGAAAEKIGEGASPVKAAISGAATSVKEKITGLFKGKGSAKRPTNIIEDLLVGAPVEVVFSAWTQYEEFAGFMKGVEKVTQGESDDQDEEGEESEEETDWSAKIFVNRRSWKATTTDYDPPNRISWTSEGAKGSVDGTITFTPVGDNATLMLVALEYRSKGPIEWIGNRWRAVGRRVRLDLKHFRRYVMRTEPDDLPEPEESEPETAESEAQ